MPSGILKHSGFQKSVGQSSEQPDLTLTLSGLSDLWGFWPTFLFPFFFPCGSLTVRPPGTTVCLFQSLFPVGWLTVDSLGLLEKGIWFLSHDTGGLSTSCDVTVVHRGGNGSFPVCRPGDTLPVSLMSIDQRYPVYWRLLSLVVYSWMFWCSGSASWCSEHSCLLAA